jgi:uncharacterized protein
MEKHIPDFGKQLNPFQRGILISAGTISLMLGVLGIPLPLLPTTPFLLLSAWCYARSSRKFYFWLMNHKYLGEHLRLYRLNKGIRLKIKVTALILLWASIGFSCIAVLDNFWLRLLLLIIATAVTIHILKLKTIESNPG